MLDYLDLGNQIAQIMSQTLAHHRLDCPSGPIEGVSAKGHGDVVTAMDVAIENELRTSLCELLPGPLFGERSRLNTPRQI